MKLSDINTFPIYDTILPSSGKKIRFRPFVVKEERALLSAYESEDSSVMLNTLVSVVKNCLQDKVKSLTTFDIEYLFMQIRSRSVGEYSQLVFTCEHCEEKVPVNVDIRTAEVDRSDQQKTIKLSDTLTIVMKYPTIEEILDIESDTHADNILRKTICSAMDKVYSGVEVIKVEDETPEDIIAFIDKLPGNQFKKLEDFITNIPSVSLVKEWKCPKCNGDNKEILKGIYSFF